MKGKCVCGCVRYCQTSDFMWNWILPQPFCGVVSFCIPASTESESSFPIPLSTECFEKFLGFCQYCIAKWYRGGFNWHFSYSEYLFFIYLRTVYISSPFLSPWFLWVVYVLGLLVTCIMNISPGYNVYFIFMYDDFSHAKVFLYSYFNQYLSLIFGCAIMRKNFPNLALQGNSSVSLWYFYGVIYTSDISDAFAIHSRVDVNYAVNFGHLSSGSPLILTLFIFVKKSILSPGTWGAAFLTQYVSWCTWVYFCLPLDFLACSPGQQRRPVVVWGVFLCLPRHCRTRSYFRHAILLVLLSFWNVSSSLVSVGQIKLSSTYLKLTSSVLMILEAAFQCKACIYRGWLWEHPRLWCSGVEVIDRLFFFLIFCLTLAFSRQS